MTIHQGCDSLLRGIHSLLVQGAAARQAAAELRQSSTQPLSVNADLGQAFAELADCLERTLEHTAQRMIDLQNLIAQFPRSQPTPLD